MNVELYGVSETKTFISLRYNLNTKLIILPEHPHTEGVADYEFPDTERSRSVLLEVFEVVSTSLNHLIVESATA